MIQQIGGDFSNARFTRKDSRPKSLASKGPRVTSRIVRSERFLIDRLENSDVFPFCISHPIGATSPIISQLRIEFLIEAYPYLLNDVFQDLRALDCSVYVNIRMMKVDIFLDSEYDN